MKPTKEAVSFIKNQFKNGCKRTKGDKHRVVKIQLD